MPNILTDYLYDLATKANQYYQEVRVLQEADEKLGLEVGADAYMTKPFDPGKLLAKIKELLEKDRRQDGQ